VNPTIRNMKKADLNEVVQLHIRAFPDFFLTSLGTGFLRELYINFLKDDSTIFKVVQNEGHIKGFVVGSLKPDELFKTMLYHKGYKFLFYAIKALIKNPVLVSGKLFYAMKYRGDHPKKTRNAALLSSIGVDPGSSKSGIGSMLIKTFCDEAFSKNANAVYLTTDKVKNDRVNSFYIKNGFQLESTFEKMNGRMMCRYVKLPDEKTI
jgi:ribosomal protein S18 acetylase RimI-like enzyme